MSNTTAIQVSAEHFVNMTSTVTGKKWFPLAQVEGYGLVAPGHCNKEFFKKVLNNYVESSSDESNVLIVSKDDDIKHEWVQVVAGNGKDGYDFKSASSTDDYAFAVTILPVR